MAGATLQPNNKAATHDVGYVFVHWHVDPRGYVCLFATASSLPSSLPSSTPWRWISLLPALYTCAPNHQGRVAQRRIETQQNRTLHLGYGTSFIAPILELESGT